MKPRTKPHEIVRKSHAHRSGKDYKRDCNRTCWHSTKNCEKCGALMITQGDEDDYWCEYCE